jgi:hypothetical protein
MKQNSQFVYGKQLQYEHGNAYCGLHIKPSKEHLIKRMNLFPNENSNKGESSDKSGDKQST